jgi:hypothetical protein
VARIRQGIGVGLVQRDDSVTASGVRDDTERATDLVGELGDTVEVSVALNLDTNKDEIPGKEAGSGSTFVDAITVRLTTIFDNKGDDLAGEVDMLSSVLDIGEDRGAGVGERRG